MIRAMVRSWVDSASVYFERRVLSLANSETAS
jgi:hypothetical protein